MKGGAMRLVILGHGYSAGFVTRQVTAQGWQVNGTTRGNTARVAAAGAEALIWPGQDQAVRQAIAGADAVLSSVAPARDGHDPVLAEFGDAIAAARPRWLGYLSTTGLYGDRAGDWVDETDTPMPTTQRGRARLIAEAAWQALADTAGVPLHIFRLAGIYGPGRGPFAKLRAGTARRIIKENQVFSRIHGEDIAQVVAATLPGPTGAAMPGRIWNVCDNDPAPPQDVIAHAADLLGVPVPSAEPFEGAQLDDMARSFYSESKRVRNDRITRDLGIRLKYPDYRSGLAAILEQEDGRDGL
ncbi:MAG: SDR family oxidoreductase [Paracoccus sp. (in: a-proteobacteria)]|uniref:SDR family oxidoreductase n=1 Tax=Paracoccus sp. TaxID=267 RepID=UPI0026E00CC7|nr:SDR family oxidoreductase [Paracoccus sp. (in: a-proteobacteria)]MDO5632561.1 SDR family oxidoreductase [Paracoccus sp. (in: a-proteobacteria)]